jgi:hypothetical protein
MWGWPETLLLINPLLNSVAARIPQPAEFRAGDRRLSRFRAFSIRRPTSQSRMALH